MRDHGKMTYVMVLESKSTPTRMCMKEDGNATRYMCMHIPSCDGCLDTSSRSVTHEGRCFTLLEPCMMVIL